MRNRLTTMDYRTSGFTLLELLIAIAIIGILSAIAIPTYGGYIAKANITTAQTDLVSLSLHLENNYQRILSYPTVNHATTVELQSDISGWNPAADASDFVFSNTSASASEYTIQATGQSGKVNGCVISLKHDGTRAIASCPDLASDGNWL